MSQSRNQTITTNPDAATQRYAEQVRSNALSAYRTANEMGAYQGPRVAGLSPLEQQGGRLSQFLGGQVPGQWNAMQGLAQTGMGAQGLLGAFAAGGMPAMQQSQMLAAQGPAAQAMLARQAQQGMDAGTFAGQQGMLGGGVLGQMAAAGPDAQRAVLQQAMQANAMGAQQMQQGGGVLSALAGQAPSVQAMLAQQAAQGGGLTADMAARYGQGADVLSGAAGMTGGALSAQQQAAMGLLAPGLAAQQAALAGGPDVSAFLNPFQSQVIDATRASFDSARNRLNRDVSDRAVAAGAFGGSREAVTRGQALADLARDETQQISGLLSSGFTDAMSRAMADQQFRFGAGSQMANTGLGVLDTLAGRGLGAGSQLVSGGMAAQQQGANALNQLFGGAQAAGGQLLTSGLAQQQLGAGLTGQVFSGAQNAGGQLFNGLMAQQAQGANALSQLFGGAQNATQFNANLGMQGANTLFGTGVNAQNALFNSGLNGIGLLGQFGALDRGVQQAILDQNRLAYEEPLQRRLQALGALGIGFNGSGQVQVVPQSRNMAAGALGGAATGASIGGQIGGPWGAGIGAVGGGLLGLFG